MLRGRIETTECLFGIADRNQRAGCGSRLFFDSACLFGRAILPKKGRTSASISKAWPMIAATTKARKMPVKATEKRVVMSVSHNPQVPCFLGRGDVSLGSAAPRFCGSDKIQRLQGAAMNFGVSDTMYLDARYAAPWLTPER